MADLPIPTADAADALLHALERRLADAGRSYDLVVIGGSALLALDLVERATRDVDVVAMVDDGTMVTAFELPPGLVTACERVARDLAVPADWLNNGPAELLRFGLPDGVEERWEVQSYGSGLTVRWISRTDQIHLKLYASVDRGGKHVRDLQALAPTASELVAAAHWARGHDPSEGFLEILREALAYFGVRDVDLGD
jgi:hypothetical protein